MAEGQKLIQPPPAAPVVTSPTTTQSQPVIYMTFAPQQQFAQPGQVLLIQPPPNQPVVQYASTAAHPPNTAPIAIAHPNYQTIDSNSLPSHHLILIIVITTLCLVVNVTSLAFGIPAVLCAYFAYTEKQNGNYGGTKKYSYVGLILSFINLGYTGVVTLLILGLTFSFYCDSYSYCGGYYD